MVLKTLVLGNISYRRHVTDEGELLQQGLVSAGWGIAGRGYTLDSVSVPAILDAVQPDLVFVQDPRDFDRNSPGCYDPTVSFVGLHELAKRPEIFVVTVVKDAGTAVAYQQEMAERIGARAIVVYYHPDSVMPLSPWLRRYPLVRTYHAVSASECAKAWERCARVVRKPGLVSGALSDVYPLRTAAVKDAALMGLDVLPHPGYGIGGSHVPRYLDTLGSYKVHVATASRYGFALRKIIESVAMGCTPVTDLPVYDALPWIDGALVRMPVTGSPMSRLLSGLEAAREWDRAERMLWADHAMREYDYLTQGRRLSTALHRLAQTAHSPVATNADWPNPILPPSPAGNG